MNYKLRNFFSLEPKQAIEEILKDRGVQDVEGFTHPGQVKFYDPFLLDHMQAGVNMLQKHLKRDDRICIVVDADADGFTSAAIIWLYIKDPTYYPDAKLTYIVQDGKRHGLEHIVEDLVYNAHYELVICPDSSTNDIEYIKQLQEVGTDVLVIDHHEKNTEGYDDVPANEVLINNQCSESYPNKTLCGAGMAYKFCCAVDATNGTNRAEKYLDLAALGEIADVMNKTSIETNAIIERGLANIENGFFKELIVAQEYSLKEKSVYPFPGLNSTDVAFYIAPLINSVVRTGTLKDNYDMFYAFIHPYELIDSTKRGAVIGDQEYVIERFIRIANGCKRKQNLIKEESLGLLKDRICCEGLDSDSIMIIKVEQDDNIPPAMRGLIASNLVSLYGHPVLIGSVNSAGELRGSIRGNDNFFALPNLKKFLEDTGYFTEIAGHANAAGFTLPVKNIEAFTKYCNSYFKPSDFDNCYLVDYALSGQRPELHDLFYQIGMHANYFGNGVDEVKVLIKDIPLDNIRVMGKENDTVKISFNGIDYIHFKDKPFANRIIKEQAKGSKISVVGAISLNSFGGRTTVQILVDDYEFVRDDADRYDF